MKKGYLYTTVFMLVLSLILISALALANAGFSPIIAKNLELAEKRAVLDALGMDATGSDDQIAAAFEDEIRAARSAAGQSLHVRIDAEGNPVGLVVPFNGSGLWGKIRGFVALSPDLETLLGLVFVEQNETPGLGGRIEENQFRDKFRGLSLVDGVPLAYGATEYEQLDAIAGATSSSRAVLQILNEFINEQLPGLTDGLEVIP